MTKLIFQGESLSADYLCDNELFKYFIRAREKQLHHKKTKKKYCICH